ncbi:MAG: LON peptidase substrate-binding domain-containing protein, partial [Chloroflexus sp.]|nr:LON peptidase substrate-binding domain-containing protein [Chloroflexus sp.]
MNDETLHDHASEEIPETLPLIPLEGAVVFPYTVVSLTLDDLGAAAAEAAAREGRKVLLAARRPDPPADAPIADQLFRVGVVARIEQLGTLPTGATGVVVRGLVRAELIEATQTSPYLRFS